MVAILFRAGPGPIIRHLLKNTRVSEVNAKTLNIIEIDPKIKGQAVIPEQAGDGHTCGGTIRQRHGLTEGTAVHVVGGAVLRVEGPVEAGTVGIVAVKVLEAQGIGIIRDQLIICHVIVQIQTGHLGGGEGGAVAPVLQLVVIDVGHVIILVCAVVDGDVIAAVVLVVVQVILDIVILIELSVVVIVGSIVVVPGLEICAIGIFIADVIGSILIEKVRKLNIRTLPIKDKTENNTLLCSYPKFFPL